MKPADRAREFRKGQTWAESRLWRLLRDRRLAGYKFRRQHPEGPYFLDFYCLEARLALELDGSGHGFPDQQQHDQARDAYLAARGIAVHRVWNHHLKRWEDRQSLVH